MDMPNRHNFKIEISETLLVQWTDYPESVFANNMRVNHGRLETCCNGCKPAQPIQVETRFLCIGDELG